MPLRRPTIASLAIGIGLLLWPSAAAVATPRFSLPAQIAAPERVKLERVVDHAFVSTRIEAQPYVARPAIFEYLLDHPEFATHVTRALRVARYRIWQTPDGLFLDDGWGAKGHLEVVHTEPGMRVLYARGHYEHPLLPDVRGEAVVVLQYAFRPALNGHPLVATTITGYVSLDSRVLSVVGTVALPLAQAKADREARELLRVFARVTRAIEEEPERVYGELRQRPDVPQHELAEFWRLLDSR